jgi:hypothetical protein
MGRGGCARWDEEQVALDDGLGDVDQYAAVLV